MGQLVFRGFIVGIVAGLLAFGWAKTFGEPAVNVAINFESAQHAAEVAAAAAAGKPRPPPDLVIFSRTVQSGVGLLTGMVGAGAGLGCLFAVLFAFGNGRMGKLGPGATSALIAFFGLMTVYVVPMLKYPANPPSVGLPETIKYRTGLYFLMMAISIAATLAALRLRKSLAPRFGSWNGSLLALGAYLVVIAIAYSALPGIDEVPKTFPAVTLWNFRVASFGIQTILWGSLGVIFGYVGARTTR
jgi:Probable cobalt transporter subunit (CbtA)